MNPLPLNKDKKRILLFVFFLLLYEIAAYIANDMCMPAMVDIIRDFNVDESWVAPSLTAFILGGSSLQLLLGPLADYFGRRPVMLVGVAFFILWNIVIAASFSMFSFVTARFFQGMDLSFISVVGYVVLHELLDSMEAVRIISIMGNITILAPLAGPLAGAVVIHFFSWRIIFVMIALIAGIAFVGLNRYMPETLFLNKEKKENKWKVVQQNYMLLLKNKTFLLASTALGAATVPFIAWIGVSPLILIKNGHLTPMQYALWQFPVFGSAMLGGFLMRRYSYGKNLPELIFYGTCLIGAGTLALGLFALLFHGAYLGLILGFTCYGIGLGFVSAPLTRFTLFVTSASKGITAALQSTINMLLIASGIALAGFAYAHQNNFHFVLFCIIYGIIYCLLYFSLRSNFKSLHVSPPC